MTMTRGQILMYTMNCINRNALPQARVQGLEQDTDLEGVQYNVALSALFVGYVNMQIPSNMLLGMVRPSCTWLAAWWCGVLPAVTAATRIVSAAFPPCVSSLVSPRPRSLLALPFHPPDSILGRSLERNLASSFEVPCSPALSEASLRLASPLRFDQSHPELTLAVHYRWICYV